MLKDIDIGAYFTPMIVMCIGTMCIPVLRSQDVKCAGNHNALHDNNDDIFGSAKLRVDLHAYNKHK